MTAQAAGSEMEDLPQMSQLRMRGYGRERLELSLSVINQMLASDYARLVARPRSIRIALFPQIVSLHTKVDLDRLYGLNAVLIRKIEIWLIQHRTRLRRPRESIDAVICNFRPKGWTRLTTLAPAGHRADAGGMASSMRCASAISIEQHVLHQQRRGVSSAID